MFDSGTRGRGLDHAEPTSRVVEDRGDLLVRAGLADVALRNDVVGRAEHHRAELQRVDPEIEQRAATLSEIEQPVLGHQRHTEAEVGLDDHRLADALFAQ